MFVVMSEPGLYLLKLKQYIFMRKQHLSHPDKHLDDAHAHGGGPPAPQYVRQHQHTMFRKCIRQCWTEFYFSRELITFCDNLFPFLSLQNKHKMPRKLHLVSPDGLLKGSCFGLI